MVKKKSARPKAKTAVKKVSKTIVGADCSVLSQSEKVSNSSSDLSLNSSSNTSLKASSNTSLKASSNLFSLLSSRADCHQFYLLVLVIVVLDQITKWIAVSKLSLNESLFIVGNFFSFVLIHNTGASFGILKDATIFLILISIVVAGFILYYRSSIPPRPCLLLGILLGGVVGNLIDRVMYGYVIDFISFSFWPAFNIADIAITVGAVGLIIYFMFFAKE